MTRPPVSGSGHGLLQSKRLDRQTGAQTPARKQTPTQTQKQTQHPLNGVVDVWLVLPLELDGLGIAAALDVEHTCRATKATKAAERRQQQQQTGATTAAWQQAAAAEQTRQKQQGSHRRINKTAPAQEAPTDGPHTS